MPGVSKCLTRAAGLRPRWSTAFRQALAKGVAAADALVQEAGQARLAREQEQRERILKQCRENAGSEKCLPDLSLSEGVGEIDVSLGFGGSLSHEDDPVKVRVAGTGNEFEVSRFSNGSVRLPRGQYELEVTGGGVTKKTKVTVIGQARVSVEYYWY
jgi:hypothetical protein